MLCRKILSVLLIHEKRNNRPVKKRWIPETILPVGQGCGARSVANFWSHSDERIRQNNA